MIHYTLNTGDTFDTRHKKTPSKKTLKLLKPIARRAILEGQTTAPLPEPFEKYNVKITVDGDFALFDLYYEQEICATNAVAWEKENLEEKWQIFENLYLKLAGQFQAVSILRSPSMPVSLPWLASFVLPHPLIDTWMADFEQCMAIALIQEAKPKRRRSRGF
jgi:hypothetical protein